MTLATNNFESLTPAVFYILLSLSRHDMHGYGIMKQVATDSDNTVNMGPGTLYGTIQRMLNDKLITEASSRKKEERRKYYTITNLGKKTLSMELDRLKTAMNVAKTLNLLPK
jgi:DNA-binding PadR family transcriptional regulator